MKILKKTTFVKSPKRQQKRYRINGTSMLSQAQARLNFAKGLNKIKGPTRYSCWACWPAKLAFRNEYKRVYSRGLFSLADQQAQHEERVGPLICESFINSRSMTEKKHALS